MIDPEARLAYHGPEPDNLIGFDPDPDFDFDSDNRKGTCMAYGLKTKIWQTGALEWWGLLDGEDVFLGRREFPLPPAEGDEWLVRETGEVFRIIGGEVRRVAPEERQEEG